MKKGKPPVIATCNKCGVELHSKYAAKKHRCIVINQRAANG